MMKKLALVVLVSTAITGTTYAECVVNLNPKSIFALLPEGGSAKASKKGSSEDDFITKVKRLKKAGAMVLSIGDRVGGYVGSLKKKGFEVCSGSSCEGKNVDHQVQIITMLELDHQGGVWTKKKTDVAGAVIVMVDGQKVNRGADRFLLEDVDGENGNVIADAVNVVLDAYLPSCN
jgi:hypothetical protein